MTKRNQPKPVRQRATRQREQPNRTRTYALILVCTLLVVSGFFFAGRQHFSSMDFGMKNSGLRKKVDALEADKRRLLLAREISLSPGEIKKAARKIGLVDAAAGVTEIARVEPIASETKTAAPAAADATKEKPLVIKTAAVTQSTLRPTVALAKTERAEKQPRKQASAE